MALAAIVVLTIMHFELVVGGKPGQNLWLLFMLAGTLLAGIAVAAYFRARVQRGTSLWDEPTGP